MYFSDAIFVIDLQDASKKLIFNTIFSACNKVHLKVHLHHFSKIKNQKESQNRRIQGFSYYFGMMIEGSGSIPLTSGSGSGRPKNMWIRGSGSGSGSGTMVVSQEEVDEARQAYQQSCLQLAMYVSLVMKTVGVMVASQEEVDEARQAYHQSCL